MICPYLRDGNFGICVAPDAIHVASIDEMGGDNQCELNRFCDRPSLRRRRVIWLGHQI